MADTIELRQGTITLDINAGDFKVLNMRLQSSAPDQLWHVPDSGDSRMIRSEDGDRSATLVMKVDGADEDDVQNNIVTLRRWLNEAIRYEVNGDVDKVYLYIKKSQNSAATNGVKHRIKSGHIDDSQSNYRPERNLKDRALDVVMALTLEPYGEAESTISLSNDLASSPHFVEDTDSDTLADGWTLTGGAVLGDVSLDTTNWLIGGQSQKMQLGAANEGMYSGTVANASDTTAMCYAWLYVTVGSVDVMLWNVTDGDSQETKTLDATDSGAVSDKTAVDTDGKTWYRVVCSGTDDAGDDYRIQIESNGGAATFYVDGCYLELGTLTAPDAWMSARNIDNRNDIQSTSAATENYLNYIDVWGVPGDAPALTMWRVTSDVNRIMYASRSVDGTTICADRTHWLESSDWTGGSDQTGTTNNHFERASGDDTFIYTVNPISAAVPFYSSPLRMIGCVRSSSTTPTMRIDVVRGGANTLVITGPTISVTTINTWELHDFGTVSLEHYLSTDIPQDVGALNLFLEIEDNTGETTDMDYVIAMAINGEFFVFDVGLDFYDNYIIGKDKSVQLSQIGGADEGLGSYWELAPGNISNRSVFAFANADNAVDYTDEAAIVLTITPRTRHLIGTL